MKTPDEEKTVDEAYPAAMPASCVTRPLGQAVQLIGDAWVLLIVIHLLQGSQRFNTLRDAMGHISSKTLSHRLKLLEELGFVERRAFLEIPPRVEYHLTAKGQELGDVIAAIKQFADKNFSAPADLPTSPSLFSVQ
jgi:DNA-binding HxlR family transcriptional regulator